MAYTSVKLVTIHNNRLIESSDLTKPLSTYLQGQHFLVVTKDQLSMSCLSIGRIVNTVRNLNLTQAIGTVFNTLLNDLFVATYKDDAVALKNLSNLYNRRLSVFNPMTYGDHEVYFTSIDTPEIKNDAKRKGTLDDLAIKSKEDMSNYLVAVNGVFHRTVILNKVLYVLDGFRTIRLSGRKDILVVDTRDVGGHSIIPLTASNVTKPNYQKRAIITTPSSIKGKTIFVVIDGYFHHRDHKVLSVADNTHLSLHTNRLQLIQQFRHNPRTVYRQDRFGVDATQNSRKYVDVYAAIFLNQTNVPTTILANKEFQYSRLTAYHSFLVVMNNPNLFTVSVDIIPTGTPKFYQEVSDRRISGMLNYACGLCPSYLIWSDAFKRKSIFLSDQDYDVDRHNQTIDPQFILPLLEEPEQAAYLPAQLIDYVCA